MSSHEHPEIMAELVEMKGQLAEVHGFLLGNRLRKNGKKGWLEQTEDDISDLQRKVGWGYRLIMGLAAAGLGLGSTILTMVVTGTTKAVLKFLGLE